MKVTGLNFPTLVDIQNHVFSAQKALELSKFDQHNLQLKIKKWEEDNQSSKFFFRPFEELKCAQPTNNLSSMQEQQTSVKSSLCTSERMAMSFVGEI